jgi:hypothetical protein
MVQLQSEVTDTKVVQVSEPAYVYQKVLPLDSNQYLGSPSQTDKIFRLPNSVYNLARSFLEYDFTATAGGNGNFNHVHLKPVISRLQLLSSGNFQFADIQNFDVFYKVVALACLRREVYLSKDAVIGGAAIADSINETCLLTPSNVAFSTAIAATVIHSQYVKKDGTASGTAYIAAAGGANPLARQQLMESAAGALGTAISFRVSIPLSYIPDSIFALDNDLFFNDLNQLVCTMASSNQVGSIATSVTAPEAGANALVGYSLANFNLRLAVEKQTDNIELTKSKFFSGKLKFACPYVLCYSESMGAAAVTSYSSTRQFNRGMGKTLLRAWNVPILSANSGRTAGNTDNVAGVAITAVQSQVDSNNIQPEPVTVADGYAYRYQAPMIDGTAIGGRRQFEIHFMWCDAFSGSNDPLWVSQQKLNEFSGLELSSEPRLYTTVWTLAGAYALTLLQFAVVQRELSLTQAGPQWM